MSNDNYDIYGDLDGALIEPLEEDKIRQQQAEIAKQEDEKRSNEETEKLQNENNQLKKNISVLLVTSRAEIERKDQNIKELRRELDDLIFRKAKVNNKRTFDRWTQTPSSAQQTKFTQTIETGSQSKDSDSKTSSRSEVPRERRRSRERNKSREREHKSREKDYRSRHRHDSPSRNSERSRAAEKREKSSERAKRLNERPRSRHGSSEKSSHKSDTRDKSRRDRSRSPRVDKNDLRAKLLNKKDQHEMDAKAGSDKHEKNGDKHKKDSQVSKECKTLDKKKKTESSKRIKTEDRKSSKSLKGVDDKKSKEEAVKKIEAPLKIDDIAEPPSIIKNAPKETPEKDEIVKKDEVPSEPELPQLKETAPKSPEILPIKSARKSSKRIKSDSRKPNGDDKNEENHVQALKTVTTSQQNNQLSQSDGKVVKFPIVAFVPNHLIDFEPLKVPDEVPVEILQDEVPTESSDKVPVKTLQDEAPVVILQVPSNELIKSPLEIESPNLQKIPIEIGPDFQLNNELEVDVTSTPSDPSQILELDVIATDVTPAPSDRILELPTDSEQIIFNSRNLEQSPVKSPENESFDSTKENSTTMNTSGCKAKKRKIVTKDIEEDGTVVFTIVRKKKRKN